MEHRVLCVVEGGGEVASAAATVGLGARPVFVLGAIKEDIAAIREVKGARQEGAGLFGARERGAISGAAIAADVVTIIADLAFFRDAVAALFVEVNLTDIREDVVAFSVVPDERGADQNDAILAKGVIWLSASEAAEVAEALASDPAEDVLVGAEAAVVLIGEADPVFKVEV